MVTILVTNIKQWRVQNKSVTWDVWMWWVSCIIHCSNASFTIIYIVFSVNFFYWSHAVHLKNVNTRQTADQGSTHALHQKVRWRETTDMEIKAGLRGPLPLLDPPISGAPLKSPNFSHLLHLVPQLPLYPAMGCWVHTIQLCRLREATGQSAKGLL